MLQAQILLSTDIKVNTTFLLKGEVPILWSDLWEGPENPTSWLKSFTKKIKNLIGWH